MTQEYEVYLRDTAMFARPAYKKAKIIDVDSDSTPVSEVPQEGQGYLGFGINPKFTISRVGPPVEGFATPEGTYKYSQRNAKIVD